MRNHTVDLKKKMSNTPARKRRKQQEDTPSPQTRVRGFEGMGIKVMELKRASAKSLAEINALLPQLSKTARPLSLKALEKIVEDKNNCLIVAKDGARIVGTGTLIIMHTVVGVHSRIENVVVDKEYRGQRIGERISKELIALAKKKKLKGIELSSRPSRAAANKLYRKLGFRPKDTNVYNLPLQ